MDYSLIQDELIKRYTYLYKNKELILALCIKYDFRKDYYKKLLKEAKTHEKDIKEYLRESKNESDLKIWEGLDKLTKSAIKSYKKEIEKAQPYLCKDVSDEIVNAYEEFLFTDDNIENTVLYKHVEALKNNPKYYEQVEHSISLLEERRNKNAHLRVIPTFTVWKILSYVKNKNSDNKVVFDALEKYYNIDRYMLSGVNFDSGYKLLTSDSDDKEKMSKLPDSTFITIVNFKETSSGIIEEYKGNEYEEEDEYFAPYWIYEFHKKYNSNNYSKSNFMSYLVNMPMISEEIKSELYQKLNPSKSMKLEKSL